MNYIYLTQSVSGAYKNCILRKNNVADFITNLFLNSGGDISGECG